MLIDLFRAYLNNIDLLCKIIEAVVTGTGYQQTLSKLSIELATIFDANNLLYSIQRITIGLIDKQIKSLSNSYTADIVENYRFILAAYADEHFIYNSLLGEKWQNFLLELQMFDTSVGGEKMFNLIDRFFNESKAASSELSGVYYLALCSGYMGKFRYSTSDEIATYKKKLLQETYLAYSLSNDAKQYNPQTYQYNIKTIKAARIKDYRSLYIEIVLYFSVAVVIIIVYFLISYI